MRQVGFIIVGITVGLLSAVPIMNLLNAQPEPPPVAVAPEVTTVPTLPPTTLAVAEPVVEQPVAGQPVVEQAAAVGDLSESISKVLEYKGAAQDVDAEDLAGSLPESVTRLLMHWNVVLAVPESPTVEGSTTP